MTLEQVSSLGYRVELVEINYNRLMGGEKVFRVPCMLSNNGISVSILALPDSGAHGFCFLDRGISARICSKLGIVPIALPRPITPKGYDGVNGRIITHFIVTTLCIDGYTLTQIPFLILDLGNQDAILGDAWMAHFDVLPDLRHQKLFWRTPPIQKPSFQRQIVIPRDILRSPPPQRYHQADADRRNKAIDLDEKRAVDGHKSHVVNSISILARPGSSKKIPSPSFTSSKQVKQNVLEATALPLSISHGSLPPIRPAARPQFAPKRRSSLCKTHDQQISHGIKLMNKELSKTPEDQASSDHWVSSRLQRYEKQQQQHEDEQTEFSTTVNICAISAAAFNLLVGHPENEVFAASMHEINEELNSREEDANIAETKDLANQVPTKYHDFLDVFSKTASDILPPSRPYDHKIQLDKDGNMSYGPLYTQSVKN